MNETSLKIIIILIVFLVVAAISLTLIAPYVSNVLGKTYSLTLP